MIPISLSIKGLYSYKEEQKIQFNELTDAGLFGIFGGVGSGKSTILEAITFALYNNTERLSSRDSRSYNMMNLQSDELKVEFECLAGDPSEQYRFSVSAKRNRKNFKEVGTMERRVAKRMPDGQWMPLADEKMTADAIIGLSYDNFRRAIIIPQGRFQDFIELGGAERTRMMKEIFKLEKYELTPKVNALIHQNNEKKATVEGSLLQLGTATPEELESVQQQLYLTQEQSVYIAQQVTEFEQAVAAYKELQETEELLSQRLETWKKLHDQTTQKTELQQRITRYEKASQMFGPLFIQKQERENELARLHAILVQLNENIASREQNLVINQTKRAALAPFIETLPAQKKEVESLQKMIVIQDVRQKLQLFTHEQQRILQDKAHIEKELTDLQAERVKAQELLAQLSSRIPTNFEQTVGDIRVWFTECRNLEANKKTIKQEATQVHTLGNEQIQLIAQIGTELSPNLPIDTPIHAAIIDKIRDVFQTSFQQKEGILAELEAQLQQERVKEKLHSFAQQLQAGEPCLLCGSTHHPAKIEPGSQSVSVLENAVKQEKNKQEKLRESQQKFELAVSKWQDTEKQKEAIREKWEMASRLLNEQKETFIWETIPSVESDFNTWVETHMQLVTKHKQTTESMSVIQANMEQKVAVIQQIEATKLKEIDQKIVAAQTEIQVLEQQMETTNITPFAEKPVSELTVIIKQKEEEIRRVDDQAQQLEKEYQSLLQDVETQKGMLVERTKEVTQRKQDIHSIQVQIDEALQHTPEFSNESDVRQTWQTWTLEELKKAQQEVQTFFTQLQRAQADLDEVQTKKQQLFGDLTYDIQKQTQLNEALGKAKAEQEQLLQTIGKLSSQIQALKEQLAQKTTLLHQLALIAKRGDDLKVLETMFRSSGFVNYISKIYLENLCRVANERFSRMTRQQLELTLGDDNTFWVRDMLNGGHLRLLKTLSGGQKFQAALSLALALADSIHSQQKMANNFFFIDEGFGSLDKGSLQIVFEALKSLRRENRIVGVISHVEELQQEIQTYLSISNTEEGSRIVTSWEAN